MRAPLQIPLAGSLSIEHVILTMGSQGGSGTVYTERGNAPAFQ